MHPAPSPDADTRPLHARRTALQVLAVGAVAAAAWFIVRHLEYPPGRHFFDLSVYRGAVDWWLDGRPLYSYRIDDSQYGFIYPPFAALLMTPLAAVTQQVASILVTVASGAVVVVGARWLVGPVARRASPSRWSTCWSRSGRRSGWGTRTCSSGRSCLPTWWRSDAVPGGRESA